MIRTINPISFDVTQALSEHIRYNLDKVENHHDRITKSEMTLRKDGINYIAEIVLHIPNHKGFTIKQSSADMYHSITELTHKTLLKLKKIKEKGKGKLHRKIVVEE